MNLINLLKMMKRNNVILQNVFIQVIIMKINIVQILIKNVIRIALDFGSMIFITIIELFADNKKQLVHQQFYLEMIKNILIVYQKYKIINAFHNAILIRLIILIIIMIIYV